VALALHPSQSLLHQIMADHVEELLDSFGFDGDDPGEPADEAMGEDLGDSQDRESDLLWGPPSLSASQGFPPLRKVASESSVRVVDWLRLGMVSVASSHV
jgi:hypothetical protein